jgi:azurin
VKPVDINNAAVNARATGFIPPDMKEKLVAYTPLAGNGETVEVVFNAPSKAGSYNYICTFPGHYALGMKGTLIVKGT